MRKNAVLFFLLMLSLIALSSCAKPECRANSDCASKKCFSLKCESYKCVYYTQNNCCGNKISEGIEDNKPGNKCTCPADYGKCEGKGKIKAGLKTEDAKYLYYYCNDNEQCVLGVEKKDVLSQNFLDPISNEFFKASSIVKYNTPFDIKKDVFEYTISLEDASKNMAFPIEFKKIRIMFNSENAAELLIAEQDLGSNTNLNSIGDKILLRVPLNLDYKPREIEEIGTVRYSVDYAYTKSNQEIVREKFNAPSKKIFFVRSE